jgi:hypothetical protein
MSDEAPPAKMSSQMEAVMRVMMGKEERTIAEKLADSNRPTWEQYKKENEDKLNLTGADQKKMDEYRRELDEERERILSRGLNHQKKSKKKKKRKYESESSDSDTSEDERRWKKNKKSKKRKKKHRKKDDYSDDESSDSSERRKKKKKSKKSKNKDEEKELSDGYRLSNFFAGGGREDE